MVLGAYTLSHAVTTLWLAGSGSEPSLITLRDFFSFGFLYEPECYSQPHRAFPEWVVVGLFVLSVTLLVKGLAVRPTITKALEHGVSPAKGPLFLAASGMTILMAGLALPSLPHIKSLIPITAFPLIALAVFPLYQLHRTTLAFLG